MLYPYHEEGSRGYSLLTEQELKHADHFSVARVRPRTSKGITDLLLLSFVRLSRRQSL
jgi:hypothetical protein